MKGMGKPWSSQDGVRNLRHHVADQQQLRALALAGAGSTMIMM